MTKLYIIGGSPCSGKSTVAEALAKKYNFFYFKVDDHLEKYTALAAFKKAPICQARLNRNSDEIWLRTPALMCREEIAFYEEIFDIVLADLLSIKSNKPIITEGAAFLPKLIDKITKFDKTYLAIIPTSDFQVEHYKQRTWVKYVLENCTDKAQAFANWMQRDIQFAKQVEKACLQLGYYYIVNDGQLSIDTLVNNVAMHFKLKK